MKKRLALFLLLITSSLGAQSVFFESIFGSDTVPDYARSLKQLPDSFIYVAGFSNSGPHGGVDITLHKLDRYGRLRWTKYYGDSLDGSGLFLNTTRDGNLVLCGEMQTAQNGLDAFLYKIDTAGNVIWFHNYGGAQNQSVKFVQETRSGDFVLAGFATSGAMNDFYLLRTDAMGNTRWFNLYGGTDNDYADAVRELPSGDLIITGDTKSWGMGGYDVELVHLDSLGYPGWDYTYGDQWNNGCQGLLMTADKHLVGFGETEIAQFSAFDFYLEKIDTLGNSLWRHTFGGANADAAFSATELPDGYMLCGYSSSYAQGPISVVVLKTDTAANLQWAHEYGGPGIDLGYEIIPSLNNGFLVIGTTNVGGDDQCYLLHLDQGGWADVNDHAAEPESVTVYPNPSDGLFSLGTTLPERAVNVSVYDLAGRCLVTQPFSSTIDLRGKAAPGVYVLQVETEKRVVRKKIVVR